MDRLAALLTGVLLVMGIFLYLERFERGQRVVLSYVVDRAQDMIDGSLEIGGIRSRGLLGGARLTDVSLRGQDGRPLLEIDSVDVAYGWRSFLSGDVILSTVSVYGPRLTLSRYPGEETFNVDRIFRLSDRPAGPELELGADRA